MRELGRTLFETPIDATSSERILRPTALSNVGSKFWL